MPKRKHAEIEGVIDTIQDQAVRIKASRLQAKIDHGNRSLKTALDLARGFERQKMGRRQKQSSKEPHKLLRLREEVIVLKELDVSKIACSYLFKQLAKTKRIKESAAFVALYGEDPKIEPPKSNAEANVLGRLFKANPVMEAMPAIMDGIKQVLNLDDAQAPGKAKSPKNVSSESIQQTNKDTSKSANRAEGSAEDIGNLTGKQLEEAGESDADLDDADLDDAELKIYDDRLAGPSDEDDNDEVDELDPMEISDTESQNHDRQSPTPVSSDTSVDEKPTSRPSKPASNGKVSSTTFLPSLNLGGYYSGSDSDNDDSYDKQHGPAIPKERKNRRGQRERQRIAELKFGQKAKHLQKPQGNSVGGGNARWDAKRGAVHGNRFDPRAKRIGRDGFARANGPTGSNSNALIGNKLAKSTPVAAKKNEVALHPSWEAARKKKQESKTVAFSGTKVTFD